MYAGVPCYNLQALAREIEADMPTPLSLFGAWRQMREIWQRQKADPNYMFDTPVPTAANDAGMSADEEFVVSIGDLAPEHSKVV